MLFFFDLRKLKIAKNWPKNTRKIVSCLPERFCKQWKGSWHIRSVLLSIYVVASKSSRNNFISENTKQYNHLSYSSFKTVLFCYYTLQTADVNVFETFLERLLWQPFQLFRRILNYVISITKGPSLQCLLHSREQDQDGTAVPSWSCSQAVSKPVWHIPLLCVQWKTPDDGQRNCLKHVEFYSKNKFEKLVHLVGFFIRIYHDARSPERQKLITL